MLSFQYAELDTLLRFLSEGTKAHICIHDISGILNEEAFKIDFKNRTHSLPFCSAAKSTPQGLRRCFACKNLANNKAVAEQKRFYGFCPNGLFEIAQPVCVDGKTLCIIYVGNLVRNQEDVKEKVEKACRLTGVPPKTVLSHLEEAQQMESADMYFQMSDLIESYIRLLFLAYRPLKPANQKLHWAVEVLKNYMDHYYDQNISLEQLARLYYINDKYIGRLFKRQVGATFHEYLNEVRLKHAAILLQSSDKSIAQIALDVGFQNIPYFNRVFVKKYKITPSQYRKRPF